MKKLYILLGISFFPLFVQATHLKAGYIQYRYIGDSTGVPFQYELELLLYSDSVSIGLGNSETLEYSSSCFANQQVTVNVVSGKSKSLPRGNHECASKDPFQYNYYTTLYRGLITLPGKCADHKFSFDSCCRPYMSNTSSSGGIYIESTLNNQLGPNNSPVRTHDPVQHLAVGTETVWSMAAMEVDGDSLHYSLIAPKESAISSIVYNSPYTQNQPLPSSTPFVFDGHTGHCHFLPNVVGEFNTAVEITEYRKDTVTQTPILISRTMTEFNAQVRTTQKPDSLIDLELDLNSPLLSVDPVTGDVVIHQNCLTDTLTIPFSTPIDFYSVEIGDIRIYDSLSVPQSVSAVVMNADEHWQTLEAKFIMNPGFQFDGNYTMVFRKGADGNTLRSVCGIEIPEFDTLKVNVMGCSFLGVVESNRFRTSFFPNPTSGILHLQGWKGNQPHELRVYSTSGILVREIRGREESWDISDLPPGLYQVILRSGYEIFRDRIILQ